jgi:hypothetical protein
MQLMNSGLTCTFLPGKYRDGEKVPELYNAVYRYWHKTWKEILGASGNLDSLNVENFLRQDVIIVMHSGFEIAGALTSTYFNLSADSIFDHGYIKAFPSEIVKKLKAEGVGKVITAEYLSVTPAYRKATTDAPLSEVISGLFMKIFVQSRAKMSLATPIRPAKVHKIGEKFGWIEHGDITKSGVNCVLLTNCHEQLKTHDNPRVVRLVEDYWRTRNDLTRLTLDEDREQIAA